MIARIITALVPVGIAVALYPTIDNQILEVTSNSNVTATPIAMTMLNFMPELFLASCVFAVVGIILSSIFRENEEEPSEQEFKPKKKQGKQTYEEFVEERLKVEEMMR